MSLSVMLKSVLFLWCIIQLQSVPTKYNIFVANLPGTVSENCCNDLSQASKKMEQISHTMAKELLEWRNAGKTDIAFSPYSIISVLQALSLGTRGPTQKEISAQVFLDANPVSNHEIIKCSLENFKKVTGKNVTILVAGRLFADEHLMSSVNSDFQRNLKNYYNSDIAEVPFIMDPKKAWEEVNDFVENKTEGVIKDFMNSWDSIELIYVNTIVFKGEWKHQFDKSKTRPGYFYTNSQRKVNVPMMTAEGHFRTITLDNFVMYGDALKVVEMPYSDEKYNMYIFMAENGKLDLNFIESLVFAHKISGFSAQLEKAPLKVVIPKFRISSKFEISSLLFKMGIKNLFDYRADLSGIFGNTNAYFNKMVHQAVVEVTEEGTIAFGATSSSIIKAQEVSQEFIVKHPFVYVIHDKCNNMVLFQGRYYGNSST